MDFNDLANCSGEWLRGSGPEADIVISSRIRLARNLADPDRRRGGLGWGQGLLWLAVALLALIVIID